MKLTKEQIDMAIAKEKELGQRMGTSGRKDFADLLGWAFVTFAPPNTAQWIHCSERLPTAEDGDESGSLPVIDADGDVRPLYFHHLTNNFDGWWTPVPKNLVKPTPPDPFEVWWKDRAFSDTSLAVMKGSMRESWDAALKSKEAK